VSRPLAVAVGGRGLVDAAAPVLRADDDALLRGRAAFETLRIYGGRPFRVDRHLDRLEASAERIGLRQPPREELVALADLAVGASADGDAVLRLLWTAGPQDGEPVAIALVTDLPAGLDERREQGIRVASLLRPRGDVPWLLGGVKSTSYAVNMAAEAEAQQRGADDAVFVDADAIVLEGPVTNVWWRRGGVLFTPALELGILAGVTRAVLLERASSAGYDVAEGAFPLADMAEADEAFTSSSVREIVPVVALDGAPVGDGLPGEASGALQAALRDAARVAVIDSQSIT
jgi:4-amino-4-deoxychorismate lyase